MADLKRILIGDLPGGTKGITVSLPGYDVTTATPEQLAFSSEFPPLSVKSKHFTEQYLPSFYGGASGADTIAGSYPSSASLHTIAAGGLVHGLSYAPLLITAFEIRQAAGPTLIERGVFNVPSLVFDVQLDPVYGVVGFRKVWLASTSAAVYFYCRSYAGAGVTLPARAVNCYFYLLYQAAA